MNSIMIRIKRWLDRCVHSLIKNVVRFVFVGASVRCVVYVMKVSLKVNVSQC